MIADRHRQVYLSSEILVWNYGYNDLTPPESYCIIHATMLRLFGDL